MGTSEFGVPTLNQIANNFNLLAIVTNYDKPSGRGLKIRNSAVIDVWIEDVSVNDYFEVYALGDTTDSATSNVEGGTRFDTTFSGFKLA